MLAVLPILFQDTRFVVLDKPSGLPVHPGPAGGPSVESFFPQLSRRPQLSRPPQLSRRRDGPWLAHRLDADTSGCLVVALRRTALHAAQAAFADRRVNKTYWAVVTGHPGEPAGQIDRPLLKINERSGWRMVVDPNGAAAATDWRVLGQDARHTWLELHPRTGRTHQIRIHCAALGCPLVGDSIYGGEPGKLHLLARAIRLPLSPPVAATAPPPAHMLDALHRLGFA